MIKFKKIKNNIIKSDDRLLIIRSAVDRTNCRILFQNWIEEKKAAGPRRRGDDDLADHGPRGLACTTWKFIIRKGLG